MTTGQKNPNDRMTQNIRFAFFGTPALATVFLDQLEAGGFVPSVVITASDKPQRRGLALTPPPVKVWAEARGLRILQPETFDETVIDALQKMNLDLGIVIYYGKVLPRAVLDIPRRGILNVHFSLLPRWRGTSPVRAAIANRDKEFGTSIILLDEQIDHGPVIAQKRIAMSEWPPHASELEQRATTESAKLLLKVLPSWIGNEIEAHVQNHDVATQCPAFEKQDGLLDLSDDARENLLKIRAFDTSIGTYAFFERNGKKIRVQILDAHIANGKLVIDRVKPEGKKEMRFEDFLRSGAKPLQAN